MPEINNARDVMQDFNNYLDELISIAQDEPTALLFINTLGSDVKSIVSSIEDAKNLINTYLNFIGEEPIEETTKNME